MRLQEITALGDKGYKMQPLTNDKATPAAMTEKKVNRDVLTTKYDDFSGKRMFIAYVVEFRAAWPFDIFMEDHKDGSPPYPVLTLPEGRRPLLPSEIISVIRHEISGSNTTP